MHRLRPSDFRPASEATLVDELCAQLPALLGVRAPSWGIEREVVVGGSIADVVVLLRGALSSLPELRPLSVGESVILAVLRRDGATTTAELTRRCGLNGKTTRMLRRLDRLGLVKCTARGRVSAGRLWLNSTKILAVEAKLLRWRDALTQAISYQRYADESYVALPEAYAQPAVEGSASFRAAGIGLLVVSEYGVRRVIPAVTAQDHDWRREFVYSRLSFTGSSRIGRGRPPRRTSAGAAC
jgi:hypothetical protein